MEYDDKNDFLRSAGERTEYENAKASIRLDFLFVQAFLVMESSLSHAPAVQCRRKDQLLDGVEQYVGKGYEKSGVDFSGGESQKLAIARALLKGSSVVVLDEPTAALDPIVEMELYRQISGLAGEKSCVFITHRLAGVRFSNRILYFESGHIAEQGSCHELLDKGGKFYEFYQLQAQMY
ncbi:MAG: ATP-binding cassette domain-containing protein [Muribaculum sp.]|nr:ATP-binding cassette domain-containing protein [Muribaculum sp.]